MRKKATGGIIVELLMDNLKAVLRRKGETETQEGEEEKNKAGLKDLSGIALKVAAILAISFIVSRVSFFYVMYPCGLALITVLMAKGKGGIYALIPVLLGLLSSEGLSSLTIGGAASILICGFMFYALKKKEISLTSRALLAAGICVAAKTAVSIALHTFYTYDGFSVLGEGLLVLFFVFIFGGLFSLIEKENPAQPVSANIFILTVTGLLLTGGVLPQVLGPIAPLNAAALCIVLLTGYKLGVMEGATAGAAAGLMLFGIANQGPAIMGILACGGMAAGLLRGDKRLYAATCFCAVCLSFGFLKGYPNLYMTVYEPVLASLVFLIMPQSILEKADKLLAKAGRDDAYYELLEKNRILSVLNEYRETFSYLALVYGPGKDGKRIPRRTVQPAGANGGTASASGSNQREERSGRSVASYQFAGIACALDGMMKELKHVERPVLIKEERFKVKVATAGYARCEGVSGDSTLNNHIRKGEYLLALADGMGKGEKAAQESNLTLNTLYNLMRAGFEPELALRMINSLLLMKSTEEIFSTVDMGLVNLYTGRLRLFKIGAATTFIKRGDKVETLKASSLPLGMVEKISVDSIEVSLRKGDQIIIVSDGITEADRGRVLPSELQRAAMAGVIEMNRTAAGRPAERDRDGASKRTSTEERQQVNLKSERKPALGKTGTDCAASAGSQKAEVRKVVKYDAAASEKGEHDDIETIETNDDDKEFKMDWNLSPEDFDRDKATKVISVKKEDKEEKKGSGKLVEFDWTIPPSEEDSEEKLAAAALAERIRIRNCVGQQSGKPAPAIPIRRFESTDIEGIHEDWLIETIAQIKSTDPQTVSDLILNRAVERCGLKEKDDMTVITAYIS